MERSEQAGLGVAIVGHGLLLAALSLSLMSPPELPKTHVDPVEVELIDDVALHSAASQPAPPPPAAAPASESAVEEVQAPTPLPPAPPPPKIEPVSEPAPKPMAKPVVKPPLAPKPVPKPVAKPAPTPVAAAPAKPRAKAQTKPSAAAKAKPATFPATTAAADTRPRRRPGLSHSILDGLSDIPAPAQAKPKATTAAKASPATAPARTGIALADMTGAQKSGLNALVNQQLRPHWKPPTGADSELLVTKLSVHLNRDGSLSGEPELVAQSGVNDSNLAQAKLHLERAIQAVHRAAPFKLPPDFYDGWKWLNPLTFDGKLAR